MTTKTADHTVTEDPIAAAEAAAEALKAKTLATVRPEQQRWDPNQLAILRQLGIEDATQADLDLFFHYCRTTGLDPFRKQIYMIGRNTKVSEWVGEDGNRRKVDRFVTKYTIQTGIDGYRRNGREAAKKFGDTLRFEGPFYTGEDDFTVLPDGKVVQHWREVWPKGKPPHAAKFTVYRNGEPFEAVVHYDEFVQTNAVYEGYGQNKKKVGDVPNSMWDKMPRNQTGKCAEAMAWRRAYPDDFAGLIMEDAAQPTIIDQDGNVEREGAPRTRPSTSNLRERSRQATQPQEPMDAEVVDPETVTGNDEPESAESARAKWERAMFAALNEGGCKDRDAQLVAITVLAGRDLADQPKHRNGISDAELRRVVQTLSGWKEEDRLAAALEETLAAVSGTPDVTTEQLGQLAQIRSREGLDGDDDA